MAHLQSAHSCIFQHAVSNDREAIIKLSVMVLLHEPIFPNIGPCRFNRKIRMWRRDVFKFVLRINERRKHFYHWRMLHARIEKGIFKEALDGLIDQVVQAPSMTRMVIHSIVRSAHQWSEVRSTWAYLGHEVSHLRRMQRCGHTICLSNVTLSCGRIPGWVNKVTYIPLLSQL